MCEHHPFRFDEDKAYEDQLVSTLEASPEHSLSAPEAPRRPGVFVIFRGSVPVYVGKAKDLRSRLNDHLKRTANRKGINVQEVSCRFLTLDRRWEVLRAKAALSRRYNLK
jgi:excinuclease ABC subunit C